MKNLLHSAQVQIQGLLVVRSSADNRLSDFPLSLTAVSEIWD